MQSIQIPPHLRRPGATQSQEVLTKATTVQPHPMPPHPKPPGAAQSQEVLTKAGWVPPHLRKQRTGQISSGALHPKEDVGLGSYVADTETVAKHHVRTETAATELLIQSAAPSDTGSTQPQMPAMASASVLTPHRQMETKSVSPKSDFEAKLTQTPNQKLPPHLRRGNMFQTPKPLADNKRIFTLASIPSSPMPLSGAISTSLTSSDQIPVQLQKELPNTPGAATLEGVPKWPENVVSSNNSPLSAVGSRAMSNRFASPISITSPDPSSAGSPTQIFPFHLRKAQASSSPITSEINVKQDCSQSSDNTGFHCGNESEKLPPHLRQEPSFPAANTDHFGEQKSPAPLNGVTSSHGNCSQLSNMEATSHYIPPHLRGKKSNTKQSSDLNKSTAASVPNDTASGRSSSALGGVPLSNNRKASTGPKVELEVVIPTPTLADHGSAQFNMCQKGDNSNGLVQGTDSRPPAQDVAPRVYSDASIKTHSAQRDGSDISSEWADLRKPGPVRSLCISDDDFDDDASVKKFIGAGLAKCPGDVIKLNSLNDDYFYSEDPAHQDWHLDVTEEFSNAYVMVWREKLPKEVIIVNIRSPKFFPEGLRVEGSLFEELEHPESIPNPSTDNREKQENWTSKTAIERRQKKKLAISRRRQRGKSTYFVPNLQQSFDPFGWGEAAVAEKPYIAIHVRPAGMKDVPGITAIYNQWVLNSFIPEDQQPVTEDDIKCVFEAARRGSYPFIVAIRGDPPVGGRAAKSNEVLGFAMVERCLGFGGAPNGRSRSTATIQLYVHQECLRHGIGGHLLDQLLRRVSRLHVPHSNRDIWINPARDALYEEAPKRFHQVVVNRPVDKPNDPDFMWFDAFMKKHKIWESHRSLSVARKPPTTSGPSATFLDIVTYQHEAEIDSYVED
ncbi:hypothetical protein V495_04929 [Pseudogymnoascus sp. VKM F-4514 (FW-929)]|nr:hypothetical protein V495_04929 [Pseudogymnoascus sp. VKM F-4514 (FW-929)]KFY51466.1 hypothetical protein V497_09107 [Pseudogymnoascus sp. VKM F-4516 (FW-969)]